MLLLPARTLPEGANWAYELKLDGYRALAVKTNGPTHCTRWRRSLCVAVITCPTGTRSTVAGITAHTGDAANRILAAWWNPELRLRGVNRCGFTFIRAPKEFFSPR